MSAGLRGALAVFDDATLETLASKGLLRRARRDVDGGKAELLSEVGERAGVGVDGQRVEIGADGPLAATCSCPAAGVCRHRLAAVLLLRGPLPNRPSPDELLVEPPDKPPSEPIPAAKPPATAVDPLAELLRIGVDGAERWAGKAASRAAHEHLSACAEPTRPSTSRARPW